ncbi:hypothetical protein AEAC466_14920 [Asticcacaulis sp. AC466]|uniref:DUF6880 family protein n=1 Tax=Asticcacaulis sp. AC466 TaxID=1282362 RepID=UPI0003C3B2CA|nr:DUF6880 family protein [Asticcacaulis sp. AC466]ESQ83151.1 hypothetical protein AEAC466_14920 [Asticcacaulis sp. AC466]
MASKTTLNASNLEALGAGRLAELLMEISTGNANAKRLLRMELAGLDSPDKLIREIRKRLTAIAAATVTVGWRSLKGFKSDLNTQRRLIVEQVAKASPAEALDLMWQFIAMADGVLDRAADASGEVLAIFRQACDDLGPIATEARPSLDELAPRVVDAVLGNGYGQANGVIAAVATALGADGLRQVRASVLAGAGQPDTRAPTRSRKTSRWRRNRSQVRDAPQRQPRAHAVRLALLAIADALGDVDAYIALQPDPRLPDVAAHIADRLLKAGRAAEALTALDVARGVHPPEWDAVRLEVLQALGRTDAAQAFRLQIFHRTLNPDHLRAYLKRLPDFDDVEAEDAALDQVETVRDAQAALAFLVRWPSLDRAARVVLRRAGEIDGHADEVLAPAAEKLETRYPLAATILLRRMIDMILTGFQTHDYERAAAYYADIRRLAPRIDDFDGMETHEAYDARLKASHGRKAAFWGLVE